MWHTVIKIAEYKALQFRLYVRWLQVGLPTPLLLLASHNHAGSFQLLQRKTPLRAVSNTAGPGVSGITIATRNQAAKESAEMMAETDAQSWQEAEY